MKPSATVMLDRGVGVLVRELGFDLRRLLPRAGLSADLFEQESIRLSVPGYFSLIEALEAEANDPALALRMASVSSPELFSPPVFAALCSANLTMAVGRLAAHKRLVAPVRLLSKETARGFEVSWLWDDATLRPPRLLAEFELAFLVQLVRIGTRQPIVPLRVVCPHSLGSPHFATYFGVEPTTGEGPALVFSPEDATRPFVTASESLWRSFQPELQRLRAETEARSAASDRVRVAIQECLPCGEVTIDAVARRLRMGRRTLQRRLSDDGVTFRDLVREVRESLASHYVGATALPFAEVSFLLGFDEPSSFFRAFREWTGATPQAVRTTRRAGLLSAAAG